MSEISLPHSTAGLSELPRWSAWQEVAALALLAMETASVALWLRIITLSGLSVSFWQAWAGLMVIVSISYLLNRLMVTWMIKPSIRRGVMVAWLLIAIYIGARVFLDLGDGSGLAAVGQRLVSALNQVGMAYPTEFLLIIAILWLVWRGVSLADQPFEYSVVRSRLGTGIFWMGAYCLVSPLTGESPVGAIYLFIGCGLLALSTARIYSYQFVRGSRLIPFTRSWFLGILLSVIGIVGLGFILSLVMQWKVAGWLVALLLGGLRLFVIVGSIIFLPVLVIMLELAPYLARLLEQFPALANQIMGILSAIQGAVERLLSRINLELGIRLSIPRPVLLWGIILLGLILLMISFGGRVLRRRGMSLFETETLEESDLIKSLRAGLRSIGERFGINLGSASVSRLLAEARIRKIYAHLMKLCLDLGLPRPEAQTPLEFLPAMQRLFPDNRHDLEAITRAYLLVRYGELPESEQELSEVEAAWAQVAEAGRRMKQQQRKTNRKVE